MPIINIQLLKGRNLDKKKKLVEKVTQAVAETIDVDPKKVIVILNEMEQDHYAIAGKLYSDKSE